MTMAAVDYLIVGGGIAGTTAAETIRRLDTAASITVISAEPHPLYSRVLLPHFVRSQVSREKIFLRRLEQYAAQGIEYRAGATVVRLQPGEHRLMLADGSEIGYGKLLLAVGGRAMPLGVPGDDLAGVSPFRTLSDAEAIHSTLTALTAESGPALAIGGSFIGLEFPPFFEKFGLEGAILLRGEHFWRRILDDEASGVIEDALTSHGIHIYKGGELLACEGEMGLLSVRLVDGRRIKASFLGYGVGLSGAPEFVTAAGIAGGSQGIETDEYLRTGVPDVWAAGDCAAFRDVAVGRRHRLGNWLNAEMQGSYAAKAMVEAGSAPFENVSAYSTRIFDCSIAMIGDLTAGAGSRWFTRGSRSVGRAARLHLRGGRLVGAALVNGLTERAPITALIKNQAPLLDREKDLVDLSFNLQAFL